MACDLEGNLEWHFKKNSKWGSFLFSIEIPTQLVPEFDKIDKVVVEVVDLARQINLEVDSGDIQELLDLLNQALTVDEIIEMREQDQDVEEPDSLSPVQLEDQMSVENLTKGLSSIEKRLPILENIDSNKEPISAWKEGKKN